MSEEKPREFSCRASRLEDEYDLGFCFELINQDPLQKYIHVIEFSAYEKLQTERDAWKEMCERFQNCLALVKWRHFREESGYLDMGKLLLEFETFKARNE